MGHAPYKSDNNNNNNNNNFITVSCFLVYKKLIGDTYLPHPLKYPYIALSYVLVPEVVFFNFVWLKLTWDFLNLGLEKTMLN